MAAAERRVVILDAALDEFSRHGFHETSLEGVADRAGISKALIYEHFRSKRELHDALLETHLHEMLEGLIAAVATAEPPEVRLRAGFDAFLGFVEKNREPWHLIMRNPQALGMEEPVGVLGIQLGHAMAAMMQADVPPEAEEDPEFWKFLVEMAGQQVVGALRALANWWDEHQEVPRERMVEAAMNFAWLGMERLSRNERWEP